MKLRSFFAMIALTIIGFAQPASAGVISFQGFETNIGDWSAATVTRVASGTNGITASEGSYYGEAANQAFTRYDGYNFGAGNAVPTTFQEYTTSIDIFLNVSGPYANDTNFDFSSAINNSLGTHLQDFIFNGGFYNDATGPGANTNRFVISASNNSQPGSAFAKNPARSPIALSSTDWYTFQHHFYANGGNLAVDMTILNSLGVLMGSWNFSGPAIGGVGGNRYGWFDFSEFSTLGIDNASLTTADASAPVPEPATLVLFGAGLIGIGFVHRRNQKKDVSQ